ncbi:MAG: hypothetical protein KBT20_07055 [Bacteroidales bacterium]|nr:hypothetical protein [Candidatus Liminaster caballi]
MKRILKMSNVCGTELRTRLMMEQFVQTLNSEDEYLLDMQDVTLISRSAADELYNITLDNPKIKIIHLSPFVQKMLDAVILGRFQPRNLRPDATPVIHCEDYNSLQEALMAL